MNIRENIEEGAKFSTSQIDKLKSEYSKIQKINPDSPSYKKMKDMMGKMSKEQLKQIRDAKIKFLQYTAGDILRKMGEEVSIDEKWAEVFGDETYQDSAWFDPEDIRTKVQQARAKVKAHPEDEEELAHRIHQQRTNEEDEFDEALTPTQRRRMGLRMRIMAKKPAFIMKRKRAMKRAATKQKLIQRARKSAIKMVVKKFYPKLRTMKTSDLSYAERGKISDIVKKKAGLIARFAKRMVKDKRKQDIDRRKSMNKPKDTK